mmetsp:Transcript_25904/g.77582  ORF Transcript_25904/g.77582 Transcript_25904/m.77582 type:complete len:162 (-) Transcript_25904:897-1382(-)
MVNQLLAGNFAVMEGLPREEALVFFRDVTTFRTLLAVLVGQTATMAPLLLGLLELVGPLELLEFGGHFVLLGLYTLLHSVAEAGGSRGGGSCGGCGGSCGGSAATAGGSASRARPLCSAGRRRSKLVRQTMTWRSEAAVAKKSPAGEKAQPLADASCPWMV